MSTPSTEGTSADHSRSGEDVAEAIEVAERGSAVEEVHDRGTEAKSGTAPVERSAGDPEMTEGQVVLGSGGEQAAPGGAAGPSDRSSGAAQSQTGARASDQVAAGEEPAGS